MFRHLTFALFVPLLALHGCSDDDNAPSKDSGAADAKATDGGQKDAVGTNDGSLLSFKICRRACTPGSGDCQGPPANQECSNGLCLPKKGDCTTDAECSPAMGKCIQGLENPQFKYCYHPCTKNSDCTTPGLDTCVAGHHCGTASRAKAHDCGSDADCSGTATFGKAKCNTTTRICECADDAACTATFPVGNYRCVPF